MTNELNDIKHLLDGVGRIWQHHLEVRRLKGEDFNVFSILGMESDENRTHSRMLGELLNPKGSHHMEGRFLEHFIAAVEYAGPFDPKTARVSLEKHIGTTNYETKEGGRIDIYLEDGNGHSISIENKIYAGDQHAQLERYVNHNSSKNTVYYLTLDGSDPADFSKGNLSKYKKRTHKDAETEQDGNGYFCISYKEDILKWLSVCLKDATDQPILRETIKQYQILIQKLTNQLSSMEANKKIDELIAHSYQAAQIIASRYWEVEKDKLSEFMQDLETNVKARLPKEKWEIERNPIELRIKHSDWGGIHVAISSQKSMLWNPSYYGIFAPKNAYDRNTIIRRLQSVGNTFSGYQSDQWWPIYKYCNLFDETSKIAKLFDNQSKAALVEEYGLILADLALSCTDLLKDVPKADIS